MGLFAVEQIGHKADRDLLEHRQRLIEAKDKGEVELDVASSSDHRLAQFLLGLAGDEVGDKRRDARLEVVERADVGLGRSASTGFGLTRTRRIG